MRHARPKSPLGTLASTFAVLVIAGCADCRMPRLDPSGEHLFIYDPPPPAACPPGTVPVPAAAVPAPAPVATVQGNSPAVPVPSGLQPIPMTQPPPAPMVAVSPYSAAAVTLAPCSRVAPIGAEVVLVAGVRGGDNYLRTNRRLDWSLAPGSVGQFTDIGQKRFEDYLVADFSRPRITSPTTAIGSTTRVAERVGQNDSIAIARGETWIALRSAVEGVSRVTVFAPDVVVPAERAKTATVYWYDAQYCLPEPVVTPPGTKGTLTTTVWKMTSHSPREGWIVRYELTGGPQAIFVPSGSTAVEVRTDAAGRASVEIVQKDPSPGTSQIRVQLFRPADQCSPQFLVRDACTAVSWTEAAPTSPALPGPVTTTPPAAAPPPSMTPPPTASPSPATAPPAEARPALPTASVLEMNITQPPDAVVGSDVTFNVALTNRGATTVREVLIRDTYDAGLSPQTRGSTAEPEPTGLVTTTLPNLQAGETRRFSITFRVTQPGKRCHRVEALAGDGGRASQEACVTAASPAAAPSPPAHPPSVGPTNQAVETAPPPAASTAIPLEMRLTPDKTKATVGQSVIFTATFRNVSQQPLLNVTISQHADAALAVVGFTEEGKRRGDDWVWQIPSLPPEKDVRVQVQCECKQSADKAFCHFIVTLADGRSADLPSYVEIDAESPPSKTTETAPPPVIPSRLVIKVDNRNLVRAGGNQQFAIHVANEGEAAENDIVVTAQLPQGSQLVRQESFGPEPNMSVQQQGGNVNFGMLAALPPKAVASYRVTVTTSHSGPIALDADVSSRRQPQPVHGSATVQVLP